MQCCTRLCVVAWPGLFSTRAAAASGDPRASPSRCLCVQARVRGELCGRGQQGRVPSCGQGPRPGARSLHWLQGCALSRHGLLHEHSRARTSSTPLFACKSCAVQVPELGKKAYFVAIPTTSGTGGLACAVSYTARGERSTCCCCCS